MVEELDEDVPLALAKGLAELPPVALVRSTPGRVPITSCCSMSAFLSSDETGSPVSVAQIQLDELLV